MFIVTYGYIIKFIIIITIIIIFSLHEFRIIRVIEEEVSEAGAVMGLLIPGQWSLKAGLRPPFPMTSDRTVIPSIPPVSGCKNFSQKGSSWPFVET